jgi:hypothetical protein
MAGRSTQGRSGNLPPYITYPAVGGQPAAVECGSLPPFTIGSSAFLLNTRQNQGCARGGTGTRNPSVRFTVKHFINPRYEGGRATHPIARPPRSPKTIICFRAAGVSAPVWALELLKGTENANNHYNR